MVVAAALGIPGANARAQHLLVTNEGSGTVSVIEGTTVVATIPVGNRPRGLVVARDGKHAFVALGKDDAIGVIDIAARRVTDKIPVGSDPEHRRVDPRIRLAIELAAECRTGQVVRCTRRMLVLPEIAPNEYESAPPAALGQIEIPGAGKKHGEAVVLTPEQRRAVDDTLAGYLANYEAAWEVEQIDDYYLFPGSKMRMLDDSGRRWTRKVRAGAKPLSRDGARVAFKQLEAIAKVDHVEGRGWYGLRRIAADLADRRRPTKRTASADGRTPRPGSKSTRIGRRTSSAPRRRGASGAAARREARGQRD